MSDPVYTFERRQDGRGNKIHAQHVNELQAAIEEISTRASGGGGSLPDQAGNAGKVLGTDGTDASWVTPSGGGMPWHNYRYLPDTRLEVHMELYVPGNKDGSQSLTANDVIAIPFYIRDDCTVDAADVRVHNDGGGSYNVGVGIYSDNGMGLPDALVGEVFFPFTGGEWSWCSGLFDTPLELAAGVYWFALAADNSGAIFKCWDVLGSIFLGADGSGDDRNVATTALATNFSAGIGAFPSTWGASSYWSVNGRLPYTALWLNGS